MTFCFVQTFAQKQARPSFNPEKFQAELEQFITTEAGLTPQESANFFPIYREMKKKQMAYFGDLRRYRHIDFNDDNACTDAIKKLDNNEIKIKEIQRDYHYKFLKILPAGKVFRVIRAEDKFHRQAIKRVANHNH